MYINNNNNNNGNNKNKKLQLYLQNKGHFGILLFNRITVCYGDVLHMGWSDKGWNVSFSVFGMMMDQ